MQNGGSFELEYNADLREYSTVDLELKVSATIRVTVAPIDITEIQPELQSVWAVVQYGSAGIQLQTLPIDCTNGNTFIVHGSYARVSLQIVGDELEAGPDATHKIRYGVWITESFRRCRYIPVVYNYIPGTVTGVTDVPDFVKSFMLYEVVSFDDFEELSEVDVEYRSGQPDLPDLGAVTYKLYDRNEVGLAAGTAQLAISRPLDPVPWNNPMAIMYFLEF